MEEQAVLLFCRKAYFGIEPEEETAADWDALLREALQQSVLGAVCAGLSRDKVPGDVLADYDRYAMAAAAESLRVLHGHKALCALLEGTGIPCLILKGPASAAFYPDPSLRMLGDVDFMVPKGREEEAARVLTGNGYVPVPKEAAHHRTFKKGRVVYELHHEIPGLPRGESGQAAESLMEDLFAKRRMIMTEAGLLPVPSRFHHGLVLVLHNAAHWTGSGIGLRHLYDFVLFVSSMEEADFTALFEEPCRQLGLWEFVRLMTALGERRLGGPWRAFAADLPEAWTDAFLEDVLSSGNFGQKVPQRHNQRVLLSEAGREPVGEKSLGGRFVASLNRAVRRRWPLADKVPLLYPLGWMTFGTWYLVRILMGKRLPIRVRDLIRESDRRRSLFRAVRLYEPNPDFPEGAVQR